MKKISSLIYFIVLTHVLLAQANLKFKRYTIKQGLINNDIRAICQDRYGFLWFGTTEGVSRFDGLEFKNYKHDNNNPYSIGDGWITDIVCDKNGTLWFAFAGSGSKFMRYNYEDERFIDISSKLQEKLKIGRRGFAFWSIFADSEGLIWLSANNCGFMYYNPETDEITTLNTDKNPKDNYVQTREFCEDNKGNIWFATSSGLFVYNKKHDVFDVYKHDPQNPKSLSSDICHFVYEDSEQNIWVGTFNGLNKLIGIRFDGTAVFEVFKHSPKNRASITNNIIVEIIEYKRQNIIISTVNGLSLLDKNTKKIYQFYNNECDDESINSNLVRSLYIDNNQNLWVGSNAGIGKLQKNDFITYSHSNTRNSVSHNKIDFLCEGKGAELWIATPKGIDILNRKTNTFRFLADVSSTANNLYGPPITLHSQSGKSMWVGTWSGGFSKVNYSSYTVKNFILYPNFESVKNVMAIITDSNNDVWIGEQTKGLYLFSAQNKEIRKFIYDPTHNFSLSSNSVRAITEDSRKNIWIGTLNGLNRLIDVKKGTFKRFLDNTEIICIKESSENLLWIGTNKGLFSYNFDTGIFKSFNTDNGLPVNQVLGILEDTLNNLWVSTNNGLLRLAIKNDSLEKITTFKQVDKHTLGDLLPGSCARLSDGSMVFGGTEGFCLFNPSKIIEDTLSPKVHFTRLKVSNKIVNVGQKINNQVILNKSLLLTRHLTFNHKNNDFAIEFTGLHFNMPQFNKFAYRLEGYDQDNEGWNYTGLNDREAKYMKLPGGDYVLQVKAANCYGNWSKHSTDIKITILPPWWRTYWFTALWGIFLILLIFSIVKIRTYKLQTQKQNLEKIIEHRTNDLKDMNQILEQRQDELEIQAHKLNSMNIELQQINTNLELKTVEVEKMAKKLHDADQSKLRFFANISHEFRTPLTLIISPLEKYLSDGPKNNIFNIEAAQLKLVYRNAKRLFRLINQIMDFRKIDQGQIKLNLTNNNILEFIEEVVQIFSGIAVAKHIQLKMNSDELRVKNEEQNSSLITHHSSLITKFYFDPDVMEKIFYNLISNAIKYTPEGGKILISIGIVETLHVTDPGNVGATSLPNTQLVIKISDTGIGIKPENINKIFDRFYREEESEINIIEGTGIGLSYTKELVELHEGTIDVESEIDKGTVFILRFNIKPVDANSYGQNLMKFNYLYSMILEDTSSKGVSTEKANQIINLSSDKQDDDGQHKLNTVLIVEDNADLRSFIKNELATIYTVFEAENGVKGWNLLNEVSPDIVISDIMMPGMNGLELCEKIKTQEESSHIPVILLTAKSSEPDTIKGLETGADDYITKPFKISILIARINGILKIRKTLREKFYMLPLDKGYSESSPTSIDMRFLQRATQIVTENLTNPDFNNDFFVSQLGMSRSLAYKKLKALTNQSVSEFIRTIRLKIAAKMLLEGEKNITEVAFSAGFKYREHFTNYFKEFFGQTPSEYLNTNKKD